MARSDDGYRSLTAGAERAAAASLNLRGAVEVLFPHQLAAGDVDAEQIVGDAGDDRHFTRALRRRDVPHDERVEKVVHLARCALELHLPQQLHLPDVRFGEDFLVLDPSGSSRVHAVGDVVGCEGRRSGTDHRGEQGVSKRHAGPRKDVSASERVCRPRPATASAANRTGAGSTESNGNSQWCGVSLLATQGVVVRWTARRLRDFGLNGGLRDT